MKVWKGNENTTTLWISPKGLEIVHEETGGHLNTIVMESLRTLSSTSPDLLTTAYLLLQLLLLPDKIYRYKEEIQVPILVWAQSKLSC